MSTTEGKESSAYRIFKPWFDDLYNGLLRPQFCESHWLSVAQNACKIKSNFRHEDLDGYKPKHVPTVLVNIQAKAIPKC